MKIRSQRKFSIAIVLFANVDRIPAQALAQPELSSGAPSSYQFSSSSVTSSLNEAVGVVNTGALNVRSGPGASFGVVTVIYQGQAVSLLGRYASSIRHRKDTIHSFLQGLNLCFTFHEHKYSPSRRA